MWSRWRKATQIETLRARVTGWEEEVQASLLRKRTISTRLQPMGSPIRKPTLPIYRTSLRAYWISLAKAY